MGTSAGHEGLAAKGSTGGLVREAVSGEQKKGPVTGLDRGRG